MKKGTELRTIGRGGYSTVKLVERDGVQYALKFISSEVYARQPSLREYLSREFTIQRSMECKHICKLFQFQEDSEGITLLLEACQDNLYNIVKDRPSSRLSKQKSCLILSDLIKALNQIHGKGYAHRDIKPENVLFAKDRSCFKLSDFGFAKLSNCSQTMLGTERFMAPQIIKRQKYDQRVDIWSLGVLFYYILTGAYPFNTVGYNLPGLMRQIEAKCAPFDFFKEADPKGDLQDNQLKRVFAGFFQIDPNNRITLAQLAQSHLFAQNFKGYTHSYSRIVSGVAYSQFDQIEEEQSFVETRSKPKNTLVQMELVCYLADCRSLLANGLSLSKNVKDRIAALIGKLYFQLKAQIVDGGSFTSTSSQGKKISSRYGRISQNFEKELGDKSAQFASVNPLGLEQASKICEEIIKQNPESERGTSMFKTSLLTLVDLRKVLVDKADCIFQELATPGQSLTMQQIINMLKDGSSEELESVSSRIREQLLAQNQK